MVKRKSGERKQEILQTLALMLEQPHREKLTTAALANRLSISEAALYRHFASKAQMFEGLIEFIETSIFSVINQICEQEDLGRRQVYATIVMILSFVKRNSGMSRVMIGDAFVNENERLQQRMNQFFARISLSIRQSLRLAASQGAFAEEKVSVYENVIISFIQGKIFCYVRSGFQTDPVADIHKQLEVILA